MVFAEGEAGGVCFLGEVGELGSISGLAGEVVSTLGVKGRASCVSVVSECHVRMSCVITCL